MKTIDYPSKKFVHDWELKNFPWIADVSIEDIEEETGGWDLYLTTTAGTVYGQEIKTISTTTFLNADGELNDYFSTSNSSGICRNVSYMNLPNSSDTCEEIFAEFYSTNITDSIEDYDNDETPIPSNLVDKKIWICNASVMARNGKEIVLSNYCKWFKLMNQKSVLVLIASDGIILFTPAMLRKAFCGFLRKKCKHINNANAPYNTNQHYSYELKAAIDLTKGKFFQMNVPNDVLNTHVKLS